jgi:hypothetical protein
VTKSVSNSLKKALIVRKSNRKILSGDAYMLLCFPYDGLTSTMIYSCQKQQIYLG